MQRKTQNLRAVQDKIKKQEAVDELDGIRMMAFESSKDGKQVLNNETQFRRMKKKEGRLYTLQKEDERKRDRQTNR